MLRAYKECHGLDGVALRVSAVYGPRRTTDCLVRLMIENAFVKKPTRLAFGAGWRRQYVNVEDVISALVLALDRSGLPRLAYNISGGVRPTLEEVAAAVAAAVPGARAEFGGESQPFDAPIRPLDIQAARRELGYEPKVPLGEGVAAYALWLKLQAR